MNIHHMSQSYKKLKKTKEEEKKKQNKEEEECFFRIIKHAKQKSRFYMNPKVNCANNVNHMNESFQKVKKNNDAKN